MPDGLVPQFLHPWEMGREQLPIASDKTIREMNQRIEQGQSTLVRVKYCPECNSRTVGYHGDDEGVSIYECHECGRRFTLDEIDKVYEEIEGNE